MSIRPNSARVRSAIVARWARTVTSVGTTLTRRPSPFTSAAVRSAPARSSSATTMSAPIRASSSAVHEVERAAQMLGFVVGEAEDLTVAEDDPRGIELRLPADVDIADLQIRPLGRRHPEPLVDHLRVADQLHDDVAAPAVRERLD